jgi:predicted phosphodiesterase
MQVLIVGDVHGQHRRFADLLTDCRDRLGIEAAIQVGDFGFTASGFADLRERFAVPVYAIDGNHEDHHWIQAAIGAGEPARWREQLDLHYQGRATTALVAGSQVGFLGGALNVDGPQRHNQATGLPNYILGRHTDAAIVAFNAARPPLIVSHSCPAGIGIGLTGPLELRLGVLDYIVGAGFDPGPIHDCGEAELTRLWLGLAYRPAAWVFGHHHRLHSTTVRETHFVCVGEAESSWQQPVLWDGDAQVLWTLAR